MERKSLLASILNKINLVTFLIVLPSLLITLIVVLSTKSSLGLQSHQERTMSDYNTGWQIANMEKRTYITLPYTFDSREATITRAFIPELNNNMVLVFPNNRQVVEVSTEDAIIYSSNDHDFVLPCITDHFCMVELPTSRSIYHISIKFINYDGDTCEVPGFKIGSLFAAYTYIAFHDPLSLISLIVLFIVTIILVFFVITTSAKHMFDARISSLTIFSVCATVLTASSSLIAELTPIRPEITASITYFALAIIPIPVLHYTWYTTDKQYNAFSVMTIVCRLNIITQLAVGLFTDVSATVMIIPTCAIILISLAMCAYYMKKRYSADPSKYNRTVLLSILALALVSIYAMIMFMLTGNPNNMLIHFILMAFCLIHFIIVMLSIRKQTEKARKNEQELTVYTKLSKKDVLTGLDNRYSFDNTIDEIMQSSDDDTDTALIILDLNGLKYTNDSHGHLAGDDLIKRAASAIMKAYDGIGTGFRIGGDEFAVVIPNCIYNDRTLKSRLDVAIAEDNESHSLTLSIAIGISHIIDESGNRISISKWKDIADMNMYLNKQEQKSGKTTFIETPEILNVLNSIVTNMEEKDPYMAKHSIRTSLISDFLAGKMGLSPKTISDTRIAANLHDIGKVAIPDAVLNKPGKLTDEEFNMIKEHAVLGAKIIDNSNSMKDIANAIRHHHERYDGKGYPDGLSHKDIPTISRIIAIADSIDAMTSDRVYRKAFTLDYCRKEIEKNLDVMYDPVIGRIALDNWDEITKILRES